MAQYNTWRFGLTVQSAFGSSMSGDMLFGQLCWAIAHHEGQAKLVEYLSDYAEQPFMVVSDAMPHGHIPLPSLPSMVWHSSSDDRKRLKNKKWLPIAVLDHDPLQADWATWQSHAKGVAELWRQIERPQPHNTINRFTGTTGEGAFAPYQMSQVWYAPPSDDGASSVTWDVYIVIDAARMAVADVHKWLSAIGQTGFGRDASIGMGRFAVHAGEEVTWPVPVAAQWHCALTLAPCAPQQQGFATATSFYQVQTRFGRHGDVLALTGKPFKKPVVLAKSGAVLSLATTVATVDESAKHRKQLDFMQNGFVGQALHGLSAHTGTVHQGYAPMVPMTDAWVASLGDHVANGAILPLGKEEGNGAH